MRKKAPQKLPKEIKEVQDRFEHWRETRPKFGPIPEELWQAAISLTEKYTFVQVARHLRLNHTVLKEHVQKATTSTPISAEKEALVPSQTQFLQMPPMPLLQAPKSLESLIELRAADGATLTMRIPSVQPIDLVGLAQAFFRRGT